MGMQLPGWLRTMFLVVTGDGWPAADEDELRALARAWMNLADAVSALGYRIVDPVRAVRRTDWDGPAAEAFKASADAQLGQGGGPLNGLSQGSRDLSEFIMKTSVDVEYMKLIVVGELLILGAQITYLIAMSPWSFGTSTAAVPALQRAGRSFALMAMWKLAMSVGASAVAQVGLDMAVQLTQVGLRTRKRWDLHLMEAAAITGAVGGALRPGIGALGDLAANAVRPALGKTVTEGLKNVVTNAAGEYATSAGTRLVTGHGFIGTPWDLTAGAIEGAVDTAGGLLKRRYGGPGGAEIDVRLVTDPDGEYQSGRQEVARRVHEALVDSTNDAVSPAQSTQAQVIPARATADEATADEVRDEPVSTSVRGYEARLVEPNPRDAAGAVEDVAPGTSSDEGGRQGRTGDQVAPAVPVEAAAAVLELPMTVVSAEADGQIGLLEAAGQANNLIRLGDRYQPAVPASGTSASTGRDADAVAGPMPPSRLQASGRLGASDVVVGWYSDDVLPWRTVADQLAAQVGGAWDRLEPVLRTFLSTATVRAQLTSVTRGDVWTIEIDRDGWLGTVAVDAVVERVAWDRDVESFEFESGSESYAEVGSMRDVRWRFGGGASARADAPGGRYMLGLGGFLERQGVSTGSVGGGTYGFHKTVEPASIWNARLAVRITVDLVSRGERVLSHLRTDTGVSIATPKADSPGTDGRMRAPTQHYLPPVRVQTSGRLGSTDIVSDVYALSTRPSPSPSPSASPSRAQASDSVHGRGAGVAALLAQLDQSGRDVFGDQWSSVEKEMIAKLRFATLHQHLKSMMSGQPLSMSLTSVDGNVEITARVTQMRHVRATPQTEFNVGTKVCRTADISSTRTAASNHAAGSVISQWAPARGTLGVRRQIGRDWVRQQRKISSTGTSTKTTGPGEVFDGVVELRFALRRDTSTGALRGEHGVAVGFRAIVERIEAVPIVEPTPWCWGDPVVRPMPRPSSAPQLVGDVGDAAQAACPQWRDSSDVGLPDTSVVTDLAGVERIRALIEEQGREFFGPRRWSDIRTAVLDGFHADLLAGLMPAMTRGHVFSELDLDGLRLPSGTSVSATARLVAMRYRRTMASKLGTINEFTVRQGEQHAGWLAGQATGGGGGVLPAANQLILNLDLTTETRERAGVGQVGVGRIVSNAKTPMDFAIFDGEVDLSMTFAQRARTSSRQVRVPIEVALPVGDAVTAQATAANLSSPGMSGAASPTRLRLPPDRLRIEGRLGAFDVATQVGGNPAAVSDAVAARVSDRLGDAWRAARDQVRTRFDLLSLRPNLAALTAGDPVEIAISGWGWSGRITLRATIDGLEHRETIGGTEFESGTEMGTSIDARYSLASNEGIAGTVVGSLPHAKISGTLGYYRDRGRTTKTECGGRLIATSKTVEDAAVFTGTVRVGVDFTLRRFGVPVHVDEVRVDVPVQILVRERETLSPSPVSTPPPEHEPHELVPVPQRVRETMRLGVRDVVLDVAPPSPMPVRPTRGMADVLSAVDETGREVYGRSWPVVRAAILAEVDMVRLRHELKSMMAGQPIIVRVVHGRVLITAHLNAACHVNDPRQLSIQHESSTRKTEFNSGTQRRNAITLSERDSGGTHTAGDRDSGAAFHGSVTVAASSDPIGVSPVAAIGGVTGVLSGGHQTGLIRSLAVTSGVTTKATEAGDVFAGSVLFDVRFERTRRFGPPHVRVARATARFTSLVRSSEVERGLPAQTVSSAPVAPAIVWEPPARVWSPRLKEGLRDTDVVHGLADTGGIRQALDVHGRALFGHGAWKRISGVAFATVSNAQLAAHLAGMTRGEPLVSPPLLTGPTDPPASISVTAKLVQLWYMGQDTHARLNPVNETADQIAYGSQHWFAGGAMLHLGVEGRVPHASIAGGLTAEAQRRTRSTVRETLSGRVLDNGKFAEPVARYEGYVMFTTTLRRRDQVRTFTGLAPVELSIPLREAVAVRDTDHVHSGLFQPGDTAEARRSQAEERP